MSMKTMAEVWKEMEKQHGKEGVYVGNEDMTTYSDVVSTGSHALDDAIGIWGLPRGRLIQFAGQESSGKTYMSLVLISEYQKMHPNNWALFIDAEYTFDPQWAKSLGVDLDRIMVYRENIGSKIFERLTGKPSKTGNKKAKLGILDMEKENPTGLGIVVLDSVACLQPPQEVSSEAGKQNMALLARFLPPELRKVTPLLSDTGIIFIAINQIRLDPGIMWGCLHGDTLVNFADGRAIPIKNVARDKVKGDVFCINEETGEIEAKPIVDWHTNGKVSDRNDMISIYVKDIDLTCTLNHKILTDSGWKEAKDITMDDRLASKHTEVTNKVLSDKVKFVNITSIKTPVSPSKMKNKYKYDISVKDNSNYMVGNRDNGIVVHNSPESTPGGKALKHSLSMMLNFSKIAAKDSMILDKSGEAIGHHVRVRIDKNKLARPGRVAQIGLTYTGGIVDKGIEVRDIGARYGIIERPNNKTWILDDQKYNGMNAIAEALEKDEELRMSVLERAKEAKKLGKRSTILNDEESEE